MGAIGVHGSDIADYVWQLKWPPMTHLVLNWQLASLACEVSHNIQ